MALRGKIIKKTTEIAYHRVKKSKKSFVSQVECLSKILFTAKDTAIGTHYQFDEILNDEDRIAAFQEALPITEYNEFYEQWLHRVLKDEPNVTLPGKITHFALSSGTTGAPSKRIPVSNDMIKSFQKTTIRQLTTMYELDLSESFYNAQILVVGGSSKLKKTNQHYEGDLSGILKKYTTMFALPFTKPGRKIAGIKDWNEKLEAMVEKAPEWNVGVVAGVPSWCLMLMEKIVERFQLNSIHDIWPNFDVYLHGGVFMTPYLSRFEKVTGKKVHLLDTYLASEGYFAYQTSIQSKGMKLLFDNSVFFEFIPFDETHFSSSGELLNRQFALSIDQVELNKPYAMVITTNAGLYRYLLGDVIKFVDVKKNEILITGRIKQFLSLVGEHISLDNINEAIEHLCQKYDVNISEFTVFIDQENSRHQWCLGTNVKLDEAKVLHDLDKHLAQNNDDYTSARKYTLKDPTLKIIETEVFYDFMKSIGKFGSQSKFPRVMNENQKKQWLAYLESKEIKI